MNSKQWIVVAFLIALLTGLLAVAAAEAGSSPEGVRAQVRELINEAERLKAHGHHEEAQQLMKHAEQVMKEARPRNELEQWLHRMNREIDELHEIRRHEKADALAREAEKLRDRARHGDRQAEEGQDVERRLHHLRQAVEHLSAAGNHDWAERLARHAEELEQEFHAQREGRHQGELVAHVEELTTAFHRLQREVEELHEIVGDLREQVEMLSHRR